MKISFDAGHGLPTVERRTLSGLGLRIWQEWELNDRITVKIIERLADYKDVEILRLDDPTGARDVPLAERSSASNTWGADLLISNHHNAGASGTTAGGIEVYRYPNSTKYSKAEQTRLYNKLIAKTGLKGNRASPLGEANFHILREVFSPAVLIEYGYMDSTTDVPIIVTENFANLSAEAVVEYLVEEYSLVKKSGYTPPLDPISEGTILRINSNRQLSLYNQIEETNGPVRVTKDGTLQVKEIIEGYNGFRLESDGTLRVPDLTEGVNL